MERFAQQFLAPLNYVGESLADVKKRNQLGCTGPFENLHRETKGVFPTLHLIQGAKFDISSIMSQNFQVSHSFSWGAAQQPPSYHFSAGYQAKQYLMHGQIDDQGNLQARANYFWAYTTPSAENSLPHLEPHAHTEHQYDPNLSPKPDAPTPAAPTPPTPPPFNKPSLTTKFQGQLTNQPGASMLQYEHDWVGETCAINVKAINPNPLDAPAARTVGGPSTSVTGIYSISALQSISKSVSVGGEWIYQKLRPDASEHNYTLAAKWAPVSATPVPSPSSLPPGFPSPYMPVNPADSQQVLAATYAVSQGVLQASYWRRLNQRLEVAADIQMLITPTTEAAGPGRREGIASVGFKLDTVYATIRGMFDTMGRVSTVLEERMAPGLSFQVSGELDYAKGGGGVGKVGLGFTKPFKIVSESSKFEVLKVYPSATNAAYAPAIFENFATQFRDKDFIFRTVTNGLCYHTTPGDSQRPPYNGDMAKLLLNLTALGYEQNEVIVKYAAQLGLEVEIVSSLDVCSNETGDLLKKQPVQTSACAVIIFYSVLQNFIVLVFRGSASPFDLCEFLTAAVLHKVKAPESFMLPGMVHEAFLNNLDFSMNHDLNSSSASISVQSNLVPLRINDLSEVVVNQILPRFDVYRASAFSDGGSGGTPPNNSGNKTPPIAGGYKTPPRVSRKGAAPHIWFTGHSMGASLATLVLAHMLIKGCYTFGSPKCGDSQFATLLAKNLTSNQIVLYRVVNSNDIVSSFPIGSCTPTANSANGRNCVSDYKHVGVPVILSYDTAECNIGADRELETIIKNALWFLGVKFPASVAKFVSGNGTIVGTFFQAGWPFPWEHLPGEYDKQIKNYN
ncbi:translocase of outer mitochondrial membrane [Physocladia obscura]|uniref:Translocase of outer mitochondrial membrane n=1 Tax=Physocladia obscura TaxID=109957 RepID=A0AAD5TAX4_9FUNG|nr:translocase of outer mitochondrial membrane [Physocladia obscura]